MKEIELSQGYKAMVDDADFDWLNQWSWYARVDCNTVYAVRSALIDGRRTTLQMHRVIMQAPAGETVDHKDRNGLNDQRSNLRFATKVQQGGNSIGYAQSGAKGVHAHGNGWQAQIRIRGRTKALGTYDTVAEAAAAYAEAARSYFGEFAFTGEEDRTKNEPPLDETAQVEHARTIETN